MHETTEYFIKDTKQVCTLPLLSRQSWEDCFLHYLPEQCCLSLALHMQSQHGNFKS